MLKQKTLFAPWRSSLPSSMFRNLCVAFDSEDEKNAKEMVNPPTTLYIPMSSAPRTLKITLVVYSATPITNNILKYKNAVFFAIRLLFEELSDMSFFSISLFVPTGAVKLLQGGVGACGFLLPLFCFIYLHTGLLWCFQGLPLQARPNNPL